MKSKKMFLIGGLGSLALVLSVAALLCVAGPSPVSGSQSEYVLELDDENGKLVSGLKSDATAKTALGADVHLRGVNISSSTSFARLTSGGYLYNHSPITGIGNIRVSYTSTSGATLYLSSREAGDDIALALPSSGSLTTLDYLASGAYYGGNSYFKIVSSGVTEIDSLSITYDCSTSWLEHLGMRIRDRKAYYTDRENYIDDSLLQVQAMVGSSIVSLSYDETGRFGYTLSLVDGEGNVLSSDGSCPSGINGEATLVVTYGGSSQELPIEIYDYGYEIPVEGVYFEMDSVDIHLDDVYSPRYGVLPSYVEITPEIRVLNGTSVHVVDGLVIPDGLGSSVIEVSYGSTRDELTVNVIDGSAEKVYFDALEENVIGVGGSVSLVATSSLGGTITYTSSNEEVASVDPDGTVHGLSSGLTYIYAESSLGGYAYKEVTVYDLSLDSGYVYEGRGRYPETLTAYSLEEAERFISEAIVGHYDSIAIRFSFTNSVSSSNFLSFYNEMDGAVIISADTYATGRNRTNVFSFDPLGDNQGYEIAGSRAPIRQDYRDLINGNAIINRGGYLTSRSASYDSFPIDYQNNGTMVVSNTEELYYALSYGYRPLFTDRLGKAYAYYQQAKDILRHVVDNSMSEMSKAAAIYEYLVSNATYDYGAEALTTGNWENYTANYLEGFFEYRSAICDGLSKAYAVLCAIEGIDTYRTYGSSSEFGAHAWNLTKIEGDWHLVCPTFGNCDYEGYGIPTYASFLSDADYFTENEGMTFASYLHADETDEADTAYPYYARSGNIISSVHDLASKLSLIRQLGVYGDISYSFQLVDGVSLSLDDEATSLLTRAYGAGEYALSTHRDPARGVTEYTLVCLVA